MVPSGQSEKLELMKSGSEGGSGKFAGRGEGIGGIKGILLKGGELLARGVLKAGAVVGRVMLKGAKIAKEVVVATAKKGFEIGKNWVQDKAEALKNFATGKTELQGKVAEFSREKSPSLLQEIMARLNQRHIDLETYGRSALELGRMRMIGSRQSFRENTRNILLKRLSLVAGREAASATQLEFYKRQRQLLTARLNVMDALGTSA